MKVSALKGLIGANTIGKVRCILMEGSDVFEFNVFLRKIVFFIQFLMFLTYFCMELDGFCIKACRYNSPLPQGLLKSGKLRFFFLKAFR